MGISAERTFGGFDVAVDRETFPILAGILISDFSKSWDGGVDIARITSFPPLGLTDGDGYDLDDSGRLGDLRGPRGHRISDRRDVTIGPFARRSGGGVSKDTDPHRYSPVAFALEPTPQGDFLRLPGERVLGAVLVVAALAERG